MRWLADENIEHAIIDLLRAKGHDVKIISDEAPQIADAGILLIANDEKRILLTNDKDFGELAFRRKSVKTGIFLLRFRTEDSNRKAELVGKFLQHYKKSLEAKFVVLKEGGARVKKLS